jgi:thiol:disulfide interchange protein DsbC
MKKIIEERKDVAFYIKMFPLVKIHPGAYDKAKVIVCEKSLTLLDNAHQGKELPKPNRETTVVDENIRLSEKLGISSLPTLVFPNGRVISGYKDAETLINMIGN